MCFLCYVGYFLKSKGFGMETETFLFIFSKNSLGKKPAIFSITMSQPCVGFHWLDLILFKMHSAGELASSFSDGIIKHILQLCYESHAKSYHGNKQFNNEQGFWYVRIFDKNGIHTATVVRNFTYWLDAVIDHKGRHFKHIL